MAGIIAKHLPHCNLAVPRATIIWNSSDFNTKSYATASKSSRNKNVVYIDGVRTPFLLANTDYSKLLAHDLARESLLNLRKKTGIPREAIDLVTYGSVVQEVKTSNIAREALFAAGYNEQTPAQTMACISSNMALTMGIGLINSGVYDTIVAGGVEFMSEIPIRHSRPIRSLMLKTSKAKTPMHSLGLLASFGGKHFVPDLAAVAEFSTNESMGHSGDRLAAAFMVSREEQDAYALRSHRLAAQAHEKGYLTDMIPFLVPGAKNAVDKDK